MDLTTTQEDARPGVWGGGRDLVLELDEGSLKLIEPDTGACLNSQPIHAIRVGIWIFCKIFIYIMTIAAAGVGRGPGQREGLRVRVSGQGEAVPRVTTVSLTCVPQVTRRHVCHVFRCQLPARTIANALRDICKKILIERSLAQSSSKLTEKLISARDREHPARARSARPTRFETKPRLFLLTLESR